MTPPSLTKSIGLLMERIKQSMLLPSFHGFWNLCLPSTGQQRTKLAQRRPYCSKKNEHQTPRIALLRSFQCQMTRKTTVIEASSSSDQTQIFGLPQHLSQVKSASTTFTAIAGSATIAGTFTSSKFKLIWALLSSKLFSFPEGTQSTWRWMSHG